MSESTVSDIKNCAFIHLLLSENGKEGKGEEDEGNGRREGKSDTHPHRQILDSH
jgi:hypothetical protein